MHFLLLEPLAVSRMILPLTPLEIKYRAAISVLPRPFLHNAVVRRSSVT